MFDATQGVPDRRRIVAVALTFYLALFLVPVALQWIMQRSAVERYASGAVISGKTKRAG